MLTEVHADHETGFVIIKGPEDGKIARIEAEKAIILAHDILDSAEKALRGAGQLHETD